MHVLKYLSAKFWFRHDLFGNKSGWRARCNLSTLCLDHPPQSLCRCHSKALKADHFTLDQRSISRFTPSEFPPPNIIPPLSSSCNPSDFRLTQLNIPPSYLSLPNVQKIGQTFSTSPIWGVRSGGQMLEKPIILCRKENTLWIRAASEPLSVSMKMYSLGLSALFYTSGLPLAKDLTL